MTELVNLADERLGAGVVACNDEFFAPAESLLHSDPPVFKPGVFTDRGKWMDGWETRRRRSAGHDWCIVRLGAPGVLRRLVVDTSHFTGNYPESCTVEGCAVDGYPDAGALTGEEITWVEVLPTTPLKGDTAHEFKSTCPWRLTHLRLSIAPDGGVARFRAYGEVLPDPRALAAAPLDLAAVGAGAVVTSCSDMHFCSAEHLTLPGPPGSMADGWETRRRRGPGHDWAVVRLAGPGRIRTAEVDTTHYKGNAPGSCTLEGSTDGATWQPLLAQTRLQPHTVHRFTLDDHEPVTHARLSIYPDGGVARLRLYGELSAEGAERLGMRWLNALPPRAAERELRAVCASGAWARAVAVHRPYPHLDALQAVASEVWRGLGRADWLEAFGGHPRIGERAGSAWSRQEQAGAAGADAAVLAALAAGNADYERRFGHVFLVCATGLGAEQMLGMLRERLGNDPETELRVAAGEQEKITALRLAKLVRP